MVVIGIDPGDKGCIALLRNNEPTFHDMPVTRISKTRSELLIPEFCSVLETSSAQAAFVELFRPMQFGLANYKRGGYAYAIRVACFLLHIQLFEIPPKEWQKHFGIKNTKTDNTKQQSYIVASKLFPKSDLLGPKGTIKDGRSDALLIATYGRTKLLTTEGGSIEDAVHL